MKASSNTLGFLFSVESDRMEREEEKNVFQSAWANLICVTSEITIKHARVAQNVRSTLKHKSDTTTTF
jgi:hypothetical protein